MKTYDDLYRTAGYYWGREPNDLCKRVLDLFPAESREGSSLIDIGCGEGRDLIRFARNGLKVTGLDLAKEGLKKAEKWAGEEGVSVRTLHGDLNNFNFDQSYDIIYSSGSLTFASPHRKEGLFSEFRKHTNPGGVNAFNVFVEKPFLEPPPDFGDQEHHYRSGELLSFYWDWEILHTTEEIFDCNSSGTKHRHAMDTVIARKIEE